MTADEVGIGVIVRLTADGCALQLWKHHSDSTAVIYDAALVDNGFGKVCVRVHVEADRISRRRTMHLQYLEVVRS